MPLLSLDSRNAALFAAYGFAVSFVLCAALLAALGASVPEQEAPITFADLIGGSASAAAIAAGLAFVLWRLVGPSATRSRRGLRPAILGALIGWFTPILCVVLPLAWVAVAYRGKPELTDLSAQMSGLTDYWQMLLVFVALNPVSWIGLAFGALAGWIYQTRVAPVDEPVGDAHARAPLPRVVTASVLTVATVASVFAAMFLIWTVGPQLHIETSARIRTGVGFAGFGRKFAAPVAAILLLLLAPALSWWIFMRQRNAVALTLMLVPLLAIASWLAL